MHLKYFRKMSKEKMRQAFRSMRDDSRESARTKAHAAALLKIGTLNINIFIWAIDYKDK